MIVADKKPIEEIIDMVKGYRKILIAGCNECVTVCESGGKKEVGVLASALRMYFMNEGKKIEVDEITLERQCDHEYLEEIRNSIDQYDAVVSLACGVGVQFVAEKYFGTPVYPGVNTCFMGVTEERGCGANVVRGADNASWIEPPASVPYPGALKDSSTAPVAVLHKENVK